MKAAQIANKFAFSRSGYKLVGYGEVGLPVYRLTVRALTQVHKKIPPLEEFTLKTLRAGLTDSEQISNFLGLSKGVTRNVLTNLIRNEDITLSGELGQRRQALKLTSKGRRTLEEAELVVPEERTFDFDFDGLLRRPALYPNEELYAPRDLREMQILEVPPRPATPPQIDDLSLHELDPLVKQISRLNRDGKMDLLSIKAIEKRKTLYLYAVALVYQSITEASDPPQIAFVVDDRLSEEYEKAFAQAGLIKKLGFDRRGEEKITLSPEIAEQMPSSAEVEAVQKQVTIAEQKIAEAEIGLANATNENERVRAEEELKQAKDEHHDSTKRLYEFTYRFLTVFEHPRLLEEALNVCQERLLIISPWIRRKIVSREFTEKLEALLKKNVQVYIGYGIGDNKSDSGAIKDLEKLAKKYHCFHFKDFSKSGRPTHAKILLCDSKFVVLSSYNWLSFKGDPKEPYRDEQGVLISRAKMIEEKFNEQVSFFE
ncbi:MAG: hypothetical protein AB7U82_12875 [Blastocatellales bacterium]